MSKELLELCPFGPPFPRVLGVGQTRPLSELSGIILVSDVPLLTPRPEPETKSLKKLTLGVCLPCLPVCLMQVAGCAAGVCGQLHCPVCNPVCSDLPEQPQPRPGGPLNILLVTGKRGCSC